MTLDDRVRLERRALHLAAPERAAEAVLEFVVLFDGALGRYALPLTAVRAVVREAVTPVPGVNAWIAGLVNVRGALRGVVDLARAYGKSGAARADCVLLVHTRFGEVGVGSHGVPQQRRVPVGAVQAAPPGARGITGVIEGDIAVLELEELLEALL
jgi:chemotaxis signal transduction protein